jgi:thiamine-phosphate pyrophosphorylase
MSIYALLDYDTLKKYNISIEDFIQTAKSLNAKILQYRDKKSSFEQKKDRLKKIRKLWKRTLIVNDELALLDFADGVHIGWEDLEDIAKKYSLSKKEVIEKIRKGKWQIKNDKFYFEGNSKKKLVGLSTHNKEEILFANTLPLSYIGIGAYRKTSTKDTSNILGDKIFELITFSYHPTAVIGGVKIYDKIPSNYKVIGSDICKLTSTRLKRKKILKKK